MYEVQPRYICCSHNTFVASTIHSHSQYIPSIAESTATALFDFRSLRNSSPLTSGRASFIILCIFHIFWLSHVFHKSQPCLYSSMHYYLFSRLVSLSCTFLLTKSHYTLFNSVRRSLWPISSTRTKVITEVLKLCVTHPPTINKTKVITSPEQRSKQKSWNSSSNHQMHWQNNWEQ